MKMKEIGPTGGACLPGVPLDPPMISAVVLRLNKIMRATNKTSEIHTLKFYYFCTLLFAFDAKM